MHGQQNITFEYQSSLKNSQKPKLPRLALGSTQLHIQFLPGVFHRGKVTRAWSWPLTST